MDMQAQEGSGVVEWAVRGRPIPGETESGDLHVVVDYGDGVLLGVIDGLGHGREAAVAARVAAQAITREPARPLLDIVKACHEALRGTRGAVLSLASIDASHAQLCWTGVGNVEAVLTRGDPAHEPHREHVLLRSGVVGYQLPPLRAASLPIHRDDVLLLASDGIRQGFSQEPPTRLPCADYADYLLRAYGKQTDDSMVMVARYHGITV